MHQGEAGLNLIFLLPQKNRPYAEARNWTIYIVTCIYSGL
jgi:hypothetical protein